MLLRSTRRSLCLCVLSSLLPLSLVACGGNGDYSTRVITLSTGNPPQIDTIITVNGNEAVAREIVVGLKPASLSVQDETIRHFARKWNLGTTVYVDPAREQPNYPAFYLFVLPDDRDLARAIKLLQLEPATEYAEPNGINHGDSGSTAGSSAGK